MKERFLHGKDKEKLADKAFVLGISILVFAVFQTVLTIIIPVNYMANPMISYVRNSSTIFCESMLAWFLIRWSNLILTFSPTMKTMIWFKILTILAALASLFKSLVSVLFILNNYISVFGLVTLYYVGEAVVWFFIGLFLFNYSSNIIKDQPIE